MSAEQKRELLLRRVERIASSLDAGKVRNCEKARRVLSNVWKKIFKIESELGLDFGDRS